MKGSLLIMSPSLHIREPEVEQERPHRDLRRGIVVPGPFEDQADTSPP